MIDLIEFHKSALCLMETAPVVRATLFNKVGSSYLDVGAMALFQNGVLKTGLISGGCLENDLANHSLSLNSETPKKTVRYNETTAEGIFDFSTGCGGEIWVALELLGTTDPLILFSQDPAWEKQKHWFVTFSETNSGHFEVSSVSQVPPTQTQKPHSQPHKSFYLRYSHPPIINLVGAGPDSIALTKLLIELNWKVNLIDFKTSLLEFFPITSTKILAKVAFNKDSFHKTIENHPDLLAAHHWICLTHNLDVDISIVKALSHHKHTKIGILGSQNRASLFWNSLNDSVKNRLTQNGCEVMIPLGQRTQNLGSNEIALSVAHHLLQKVFPYKPKSASPSA